MKLGCLYRSEVDAVALNLIIRLKVYFARNQHKTFRSKKSAKNSVQRFYPVEIRTEFFCVAHATHGSLEILTRGALHASGEITTRCVNQGLRFQSGKSTIYVDQPNRGLFGNNTFD